ncbi:MAG: hypothetical protein FWF56_00900, partial [Firmicutes bacterium]|nr:hypothetical protein [Bacillota bacterium]
DSHLSRVRGYAKWIALIALGLSLLIVTSFGLQTVGKTNETVQQLSIVESRQSAIVEEYNQSIEDFKNAILDLHNDGILGSVEEYEILSEQIVEKARAVVQSMNAMAELVETYSNGDQTIKPRDFGIWYMSNFDIWTLITGLGAPTAAMTGQTAGAWVMSNASYIISCISSAFSFLIGIPVVGWAILAWIIAEATALILSLAEALISGRGVQFDAVTGWFNIPYAVHIYTR